MTEAAIRAAASPAAPVTIRPYRPLDHRACRELWAEFIRTRRELYADPTADHDPGVGFEEYLTRLDIAGIWVADHAEEGIVGLIGLVLGGRRGGEVEPVVVADGLRGQGIGRALLGHVAGEAKRRGMSQLTVSPDARNVAAIRCLHSAGYDMLASITLTLDLHSGRQSEQEQPAEQDTLELYELRFSY